MALNKLPNNEDVKNYYLNKENNDKEIQKFNFDFSKLDKIIAGKKTQQDKINAIYKFIHKEVKFSKDPKFKSQHKFKRSASEVFNNKIATGCTDYAMVFSVIARRYGIPTTLLSTASKNTTNKILDAENELNPDKKAAKYSKIKTFNGHSFCECFDSDKNEWVLTDPMFSKTEKKYETEKGIKLTGLHFVGGENKFIAYSRGLDYGETIKSVSDFNGYAVKSLLGKTKGDYESDFQKNSIEIVKDDLIIEKDKLRQETGELSEEERHKAIMEEYKKGKSNAVKIIESENENIKVFSKNKWDD